MTVDEWDTREVCPDGSCVGVIGPDGQCKVCGQMSPTWNNERERGMDTSAEDSDSEDSDTAHADKGEHAHEDENEDLMPGTDSDWVGREVCPDGACVGIINEQGVCNLCGKKADAA
ncbi:MAG: hypothetical protein QM831_41760 [Kofleriaceae bacterium]